MADRPTRTTDQAADQDGPHYDYRHQAWTQNGRYLDCAHPEHMPCKCYGRTHAGEPIAPDAQVPTLDRTCTNVDALTRGTQAHQDARQADAARIADDARRAQNRAADTYADGPRFIAVYGTDDRAALVDTHATPPRAVGIVPTADAQHYADALNHGDAFIRAALGHTPAERSRTRH